MVPLAAIPCNPADSASNIDSAEARQSREAHLAAQTRDKPPSDVSLPVIPVDCTIQASFWSTQAPSTQFPMTYTILDDNVSGNGSYTYTEPKLTITCTFNGTIQDNIITGKNTLHYTPIYSSTDSLAYTIYYSGNSDEVITLHLDGSLSIRGTTHSHWRMEVTRGTLPEEAARQRSDSSPIENVTDRWQYLSRKRQPE